MGVVLALLLILLVTWFVREYGAGRERRALEATPRARSAPPPPPHQRVTDRELEQQIRGLRSAIDAGAATVDEAIVGLVRTCGLTAEHALGRLRRR
jgi:hypothetical protein